MNALQAVENKADEILADVTEQLGLRLKRRPAKRMGPGYAIEMVDADGVIWHAFGKIMPDYRFRYLVAEGDGTVDERDNMIGFDPPILVKQFVLI